MVSKFGDRPIITIEQGGIVESAFNTIDGIINNMATTIVIFTTNRILIEK
jgi:hypothetical protein